jgi:DNA-binding beta-propeller fold protein YncE
MSQRRPRAVRALVIASFAAMAAVLSTGATFAIGLTWSTRVTQAGDVPIAVALSPDGRTLYAADGQSPGPPPGDGDTVTPVDLTTGRPGKPIIIGGPPSQLTVTAGGRMLYAIVNFQGGNPYLVSVNLATGHASRAIDDTSEVEGMVAAPDGRTLYAVTFAANSSNCDLVPVDAATGAAGKPIPVPLGASTLAISPDGGTLYAAVRGYGAHPGMIVTIDSATGQAGVLARLADDPYALVASPGGRTLYVAADVLPGPYAAPAGRTLTAIDTATGKAESRPLTFGSGPQSIMYAPGGEIAIAPDGRTVYLMNHSHSVTPVSTVGGILVPEAPLATIPWFSSAWNSGIAITPDGQTLYVAQDDGITIIPLNH